MENDLTRGRSYNQGSRRRIARTNYFTSYQEPVPPALAEEYRKFYATLTPSQLAALGFKGKTKAAHLMDPDLNPTGEIRPLCRDNQTLSSLDPDNPSPMPAANLLSAALIHNDPQPQEAQDNPGRPTKLDLVVVLEVIRRLLSIYEVSTDRKTRLHGEIIALALGVPGASNVADLARKYQCSRQNISFRLVKVVKSLDLPPTWRMSQAAHAKALANAPKISRGQTT